MCYFLHILVYSFVSGLFLYNPDEDLYIFKNEDSTTSALTLCIPILSLTRGCRWSSVGRSVYRAGPWDLPGDGRGSRPAPSPVYTLTPRPDREWLPTDTYLPTYLPESVRGPARRPTVTTRPRPGSPRLPTPGRGQGLRWEQVNWWIVLLWPGIGDLYTMTRYRGDAHR